jgi:ATP-dependent Lhr-like helicase
MSVLLSENRIMIVESPSGGYIVSEDYSDFTNLDKVTSFSKILRRFLENEGPLSTRSIAQKFKLSESEIDIILSDFHIRNEVVKGNLLKDSTEIFWCDHQNFAQLYRRAVSIRRTQIIGVKRDTYLRFLLNWHGVTGNKLSTESLISLYQGFLVSPYFFEREIIPNRLDAKQLAELPVSTNLLGEPIEHGNIIIQCLKSSPEARNLINFIRRGEGHIFETNNDIDEQISAMSTEVNMVCQFLRENGASYFQDIEYGTNLSSADLKQILQQTVQKGLVTTDNYDSFLSIINSSQKQRSRSSRHTVKMSVQNQLLLKSGRWFLTSSFAVRGKKMHTTERVERQALLLLKRNGILVKEFYRRESGFLPWYQIFQVLKRLEWQGEIRRGYFIDGLSGIQYALPEAVELLSSLPDKEVDDNPYILSTIDPLFPFGGNIDWAIDRENGKKLEIRKISGNHFIFVSEKPVIYSENYASRLWILESLEKGKMQKVIFSLKNWMRLPDNIRPVKKIEIKSINEESAVESIFSDLFYKAGFEREGNSIVLWPSGV